MNTQQELQYLMTAFVSGSLRSEDQPFFDFICDRLREFQILPFGTVGKFDAAPMNIPDLMIQNIELADIVVIVASKRFETKDVHYGIEANSISEMIQVEAGMAFAKSKPVIVFAEEGVNVGSFIPKITGYIYLDGTLPNFDKQEKIIIQLFRNAYQMVIKTREEKSNKNLKRLFIGGLAAVGAWNLFANNNDNEETQ